jgi:alanine racemase
MTRPTWAEISRGNLLSNFAYLRSLAPDDAEMLSVVKADAYGHGLSLCAPIVANAGALWLGVTSVEEGVQARALCDDIGKTPRILIMGGIWRGEAEALFEHRLTPVIWEDYHLDLIEAAAHKFSEQSIGVHLEIDTGMSRQGIQAPVTVTNSDTAQLATMLLRFHAASPLRLEGVMTHFSAPEDAESNATRDQLGRLESALSKVIASGLSPRWLHAGNSATLIRGGTAITRLQSLADSLGAKLMLRPGLSLYGYVPRFSPRGTALEHEAASACKPVLSWKTRVISLRTIAAGESVGYNSTFRAGRATRLALLPVGYGDGLNRRLSNRGHMLIRGVQVPIVGRISMDQTMIDVTDVSGVEIGDEVVILGQQGEIGISAYDYADLAETIPWEVLCDIGVRVPRVLVD